MYKQITERSINMRILEKNSDMILACGNILDQVHNIAIELEIDIKTSKIIKAEGQMVKVPFPSCKPALVNLSKIEGFILDSGITRRIADTVGGSKGCIHLSEVVVETVRLAGNTLFGINLGGKDWREGKISDEEFWGRVKPKLKGTCRVFEKNELE